MVTVCAPLPAPFRHLAGPEVGVLLADVKCRLLCTLNSCFRPVRCSLNPVHEADFVPFNSLMPCRVSTQIGTKFPLALGVVVEGSREYLKGLRAKQVPGGLQERLLGQTALAWGICAGWFPPHLGLVDCGLCSRLLLWLWTSRLLGGLPHLLYLCSLCIISVSWGLSKISVTPFKSLCLQDTHTNIITLEASGSLLNLIAKG